MYCPRCEKENPDDVQLCQFCSCVMSSVSQPPGVDAKTSGLAIAALVLGILGPFTCITIPLAIIFGIVALVKIGNSAGRLKGTGLAVAGIVTPIVLIPFVALLMGILMPALAQVKVYAERTVCLTNLSGLGKAMLLYADDNNDKFPTPAKWCDILSDDPDMGIIPKMFICKSAGQGPCNYAMNKNLENLGPNAPGDMVLLFETTPGWNQCGGPEILSLENHRGEGCNIMFVDCHVEWITKDDLDKLRWTASGSP
jgi:prepilin-type processing-associated H-X9-DG protein